MAPTKTASSGDKYSVILPTFNERKNLPIVAWLLNRTFTEKYAPEPPARPCRRTRRSDFSSLPPL